MNRFTRSVRLQEVSGDGRNFTALAVAYNVVDSFSTIFLPGVFEESLKQRLPKITWNHSWDEVIGKITSWEETPEGLLIHARLSDPEAVPRARQAIAQLRDGDVDEVSVGFGFFPGEDPKDVTEIDGNVAFKRLELNEVAVGLVRGAVPGAKVLAIRSVRGLVIDADTAANIILKAKSGEWDALEALQAVKDAAVPGTPTKPEESTEEGEPTEQEVVETEETEVVETEETQPDPEAKPETVATTDEPVVEGEPGDPATEDESDEEEKPDEADAELEALLAEVDALLADSEA